MYHKDFIVCCAITVIYRYMKTSLLVVGILIAILVTSIITSLSNRIAYAHNFSESENALFLTLVHQIEAETLLVQNNFSTNPKLAEQHANNAMSLLNQDDPVVNLTWTSQISERNPRIANELTSALNSLKSATSINQSKSTSITPTDTMSNSENNIKAKVDMINGLLGEAVSSRLTKEQLNNSTTQALDLANLANEVYFSYGRALGESPSTTSNMAGMAMSVKEASPSSPMSMSANMNMSTNNSVAMSSNMATTSSSSSNSVKNMTEYQTAQALASKAQEVFNKNLKTITSASALKAANTEIENDLNQLKATVDNKAPFMDVMKTVHIQLHPTLITAYNLQLKSFQ
jgi:hypothetical protein